MKNRIVRTLAKVFLGLMIPAGVVAAFGTVYLYRVGILHVGSIILTVPSLGWSVTMIVGGIAGAVLSGVLLVELISEDWIKNQQKRSTAQ